MFIPSFQSIARALGLSDVSSFSQDDDYIKIDAQTMIFLLRFVAMAADFDEEVYLKENPDIANAYDAGDIVDLRKHFISAGFFEGRKASEPQFDEEWYLETYPDVADSVREGAVISARAHFFDRGEIELRAPNAESLPWLQSWAKALARTNGDLD